MPEYLFPLYNLVIWDICFFLAVAGYLRSHPRYRLISNPRDSQVKYILFFLFFMYTMFTFFGGDNKRYVEFVVSAYKDEVFETFYNKLAGIVTPSVFLWKFFVYVPALYFVHKAIKNFKVNSYVTYLAFILFAMPSYGSTRAILAYSLFVYAASVLENKGWIKIPLTYLLVICCFFFHNSMAIPIGLFLLTPFFKLNKKMLLLSIVLIPVLVGMVSFSIEYLLESDMLVDTYVGTKMESNTDENRRESELAYSSMTGMIFLWMDIVTTIMLLFYCVKALYLKLLPKGMERLVKVCFLLLLFCIIVLVSGIPGRQLLATRYFGMIPFFLYIVAHHISQNKLSSHYIRLLCVALLFLRHNMMFLYSVYNYSLM